jgi:hypothetical protein
MVTKYSNMGINAMDISACSLRAGGVIAMLFGWIDMDSIRTMGRWHSGAMIRYLHIQAQCIINNYAARVYNQGTCVFLPDETVPIINNYGDD